MLSDCGSAGHATNADAVAVDEGLVGGDVRLLMWKFRRNHEMFKEGRILVSDSLDDPFRPASVASTVSRMADDDFELLGSVAKGLEKICIDGEDF